MSKLFSIVLLCSLPLVWIAGGCASTPATTGERNDGGGTYIPLDPLPLTGDYPPACSDTTVGKFLPDHTVRVAIAEVLGSGKLAFGVGMVGVKGSHYVVIIDYLNTDVTPVTVGARQVVTETGRDWLNRQVIWAGWEPGRAVDLWATPPKGVKTRFDVVTVPANGILPTEVLKYEAVDSPGEVEQEAHYTRVTLPVYVGIGVRLTANIMVLEGEVDISGLSSISAAADAGNISGNLVVQTLGISGDNVRLSLPLPSDIDRSTIQNAVMSLGSVKSAAHDEETYALPRIVGFSNTFGGPQSFISGVAGVLSNGSVDWKPQCRPFAEKKPPPGPAPPAPAGT